MKYSILTLLCLFSYLQGTAQEQFGYKIEINAPHKKDSTIYLAKYWDGATYIQDSAQISSIGKAVLTSKEELPNGEYLLYIKPGIQIDLLLDGNKNNIKIALDPTDIQNSTISGSKDTKLLWDHVRYLHKQAVAKEKLQKIIKDNTLPSKKIANAKLQLAKLEAETATQVQTTIDKNKKQWFGIFIKGMERVVPPFPLPKTQEEYTTNFKFLKDHYFDNIDFTDPRFWHTNFFTSYIDNYMDQYVEPYIDSTAYVASRLVGKTKGNDYCFKEMLSRFTNDAIKSKYMGMENVWAKLAEDYIFDKNIPWIDSIQEASLRNEYIKIKNNRIGMKAHNIPLVKMDGSHVNTDDIKADYTLIYFYDPSCGHCRREMPILHDKVYAKYKEKGFEVVAINIGHSAEAWKEFVVTNNLTDWINCADPEYKSQYWMYYDVPGTPSVFLLDKNKTIIARKVDVENLEKVLEYSIK